MPKRDVFHSEWSFSVEMGEIFVSLHDDQGKIEESGFRFRFNDETTLEDLENEIHEAYQIVQKWQKLSFANAGEEQNFVAIKERLSTDTLVNIGLGNRAHVVVKHMHLSHWTTLLERYNTKLTKRTLSADGQAQMALSLLDTIDVLRNVKFFELYTKIQKKLDALEFDIREYLGVYVVSMKSAAETYFFNLNMEGRVNPMAFDVEYKPKEDGMHSGLKCIVTDNGTQSVFYIKTNHGGPSTTCSKQKLVPDLREIFGYIILHSIGVAPEPHFLCPPRGMANRTLFIATREVPGFKDTRMDKLESTTENIRKTLIQIHILQSILCLPDIHDRNCGQYKSNPMIVDFGIPVNEDNKNVDIMKTIIEGVPAPIQTIVSGVSKVKLKGIVDDCADYRREVLETSLREWNLTNRIVEAQAETNRMKLNIRNQGIQVQETNGFDKYIEDIQHNLSLL